MSTKVIEKELVNLKQEVATLRSLVVTIITQKDPEGEYKPEFIKRALKAAKEPGVYEFTGSKNFLKHLRAAK